MENGATIEAATRVPDASFESNRTLPNSQTNDTVHQLQGASDDGGRAVPIANSSIDMSSSSSFQTPSNLGTVPSARSRDSTTTPIIVHSDQPSSLSGGDDEEDNESDENENGNDSAGARRQKRKKLDRSKLRKGKWTIEEEEFTSRIIHYFSIGFLALPDGATLRSYIAEKLNCDPMRVTKKYAGASCLGRRVFQVRDKPQPTVLELQLAKADLDMLERRFKVRVEEGRPGVPLSPQFDIALAMAQQHQVSRVPSMTGVPSWLTMNESTSAPAPTSLPAGLGGLALGNLQAWLQGLAPAPAPTVHAPPSAVDPAPQTLQYPHSLAPGPSRGNAGLQIEIAVAQLLLAQAAANAAKQAIPTSSQHTSFVTGNRDPLAVMVRQDSISPSSQVCPSFNDNQNPSSYGDISQMALSGHERGASSLQAIAGLNIPTKASVGARPNPSNLLDQLRKTYEQHLASQAADNGSSATNFIAHSTPTVAGNAVGSSAGLQPTHRHLVSTENGPSANFTTNKNLPVSLATSLKNQNTKQGPGTYLTGNGPSVAASYIASQVAPRACSPNAGGVARKPVIPTHSHSSKHLGITIMSASSKPPKKVKLAANARSPIQTSEDGAIMMGFLSSLRNSFESAVAQQQNAQTREQQEDSEETSSNGSGAGNRAATVTDSSSQQQESCDSVDESDWNSEDKKTDRSSSEDSDKDDNQDTKHEKYQEAVHYSKGPPRKRHKSKKVDDQMIKSRAV